MHEVLKTAGLQRVLALGGASLLASAALYAFFYFPRGNWDYNIGHWIGRDFVNFWAAGRLTLLGKSQILFDSAAYNAWLETQLSGNLSGGFIYSYPPQLIPLLLPFGALPYGSALVLWTLGNLVALFAAMKACGMSRSAILLALAAPAVALSAFQGHFTGMLAALMLVALTNLETRPFLAGVCLGLMTVKPQLGLLIAAVVVIERHWKVLATGAVTAGVLVLASLAAVGVQGWTGYATSTLPAQKEFLAQFTGGFTFFLTTPYAAFRALGLEIGLSMIAHGACAIASAIASLTLWHRASDRAIAMLALALASVLVTPYANLYDLALTVPPLAMLLTTQRDMPRGVAPLAIWFVPAFGLPLAFVHGPLAGLVLMAAGGAMLTTDALSRDEAANRQA